MTARPFLLAAAVLGGLAVALGAFGAHALQSAVTQWDLDLTQQQRLLHNWDVAVRYQMYHALALIGVAWTIHQRPSYAGAAAGMLMIAGVLVFSGCLYAYVLTGLRMLAMVVPVGGTAMIVGWVCLACAAWRS